MLDIRRADEHRQRLVERSGRDLSGVGPAPAPEPEAGRLADCRRRLGERARSVVVMTLYAERRAAELPSARA